MLQHLRSHHRAEGRREAHSLPPLLLPPSACGSSINNEWASLMLVLVLVLLVLVLALEVSAS